MTDLLDIPTFLQVGTAENDAARALPAPPRPPAPRKRNTLEPHPMRQPVKKYACTEATYLVLRTLGWTDTVINRLPVKEANRVADAGLLMQLTDEVA
jgi:hypothetical protein